MSMKQWAVLLWAFGLSMQNVAHAEPVFTWNGPWAVTLFPVCSPQVGPLPPGCRASSSKAFGMFSGPELIADTTSERAFAQSQSGALVPTNNGGASVSFTRQFTLQGSPAGWQVDLTGVLNGSLASAGARSDFDSAAVRARAAITPDLSINFSDSISSPTSEIQRRLISETLHDTGHLPDGTYQVQGLLATGADVGNPAASFATFAHFGGGLNPGAGFAVSLTASPSPIPEPSALLLIATGLLGLVAAARARFLKGHQ